MRTEKIPPIVRDTNKEAVLRRWSWLGRRGRSLLHGHRRGIWREHRDRHQHWDGDLWTSGPYADGYRGRLQQVVRRTGQRWMLRYCGGQRHHARPVLRLEPRRRM